MILLTGLGLALTACGSKTGDPGFQYSIDEFADIEVLRYQVPGWEDLSLQQKEYIYHLSEAAKAGRDITWDQNFKYNLEIRHVLEAILENQAIDRSAAEWNDFLVYAKRVFFSNGIHHHYANDKILPACSRSYFASLMDAVGTEPGRAEFLLQVIYDPDLYPTLQYQGTEKDLVEASAVNFYEGVTADEVNAFYTKMENPNDPHPISYGLNSKVVKEDGKVVEKTWKVGGIYGPALEVIIGHLEAAKAVAENDTQKKYIDELIAYYRSGDLRMWDQYNITWVADTESDVDFVNGFVEDYDDPLGRKASWEGIVNFRDREASRRTEIISRNAQWFEDNSPVDPRFKKEEVKGVSAKVINVAVIAGDNYPATAIGINLPNADWIRKEYGSKSVTIANITDAYEMASEQRPKSVLSEFAWDQAEIDLCKKYGSITDNLHTDLHECLGHGSGQLLPETPANALKEFTSTLEEARADLFGLYYVADPKLVELGLLDSPDAYKAAYMSYIRNGIMTQFSRVEREESPRRQDLFRGQRLRKTPRPLRRTPRRSPAHQVGRRLRSRQGTGPQVRRRHRPRTPQGSARALRQPRTQTLPRLHQPRNRPRGQRRQDHRLPDRLRRRLPRPAALLRQEVPHAVVGRWKPEAAGGWLPLETIALINSVLYKIALPEPGRVTLC